MKGDNGGVLRVLWFALIGNLIVASAKTIYGLLTGTLTMIADGIHSFVDAAASIMGLFATHYAGKPSDEDHHYGHQKYETLAALGVAIFIALTSWEILKHALTRLIDQELPQFHASGIYIIIFSMCISGTVSWYERKKSKEFNSSLLEADAHHTASDVWVSFSVLLSLFAIRQGYYWVDPLFSLGIALYFAYIAYKILKKNLMVLSDAAFFDPKEIKDIVISVPGSYRLPSYSNKRSSGRGIYRLTYSNRPRHQHDGVAFHRSYDRRPIKRGIRRCKRRHDSHRTLP